MNFADKRFVQALGPVNSSPCVAPIIVTTGPGLTPWNTIIGIGHESPMSTSSSGMWTVRISPGLIFFLKNRISFQSDKRSHSGRPSDSCSSSAFLIAKRLVLGSSLATRTRRFFPAMFAHNQTGNKLMDANTNQPPRLVTVYGTRSSETICPYFHLLRMWSSKRKGLTNRLIQM